MCLQSIERNLFTAKELDTTILSECSLYFSYKLRIINSYAIKNHFTNMGCATITMEVILSLRW